VLNIAKPQRRQRILITGASSGLGAELARRWAADGRDLALCARRLPELDALRDELQERYPAGTFRSYQLDVTDDAAVPEVFERAVVDLGRIDRVVAGAGIGLGAQVGTGHAEENRMVLRTNVIGTLNTVEAAVSHFWSRQAGHLVIISSMAALRGLGGRMTAYSASKAAIASLGESVRSSLWSRPITVSTMYPGYIDTAINADDPHKIWSVDLQTGTTALYDAIESERARAYLPTRPWAFMAPVMRFAPLPIFRRIAG
jgi:NAD(P)-dependent dehydrogenase (short-subunit alcohol dehydrogenase family)